MFTFSSLTFTGVGLDQNSSCLSTFLDFFSTRRGSGLPKTVTFPLFWSTLTDTTPVNPHNPKVIVRRSDGSWVQPCEFGFSIPSKVLKNLKLANTPIEVQSTSDTKERYNHIDVQHLDVQFVNPSANNRGLTMEKLQQTAREIYPSLLWPPCPQFLCILYSTCELWSQFSVCTKNNLSRIQQKLTQCASDYR